MGVKVFAGPFVPLSSPAMTRTEQEKVESRVTQARDDVRRAMALFNEHLANLAQTIIGRLT